MNKKGRLVYVHKMEYYFELLRMNFCYMQQQGWISQKNVGQKKPDTRVDMELFHLCKTQKQTTLSYDNVRITAALQGGGNA